MTPAKTLAASFAASAALIATAAISQPSQNAKPKHGDSDGGIPAGRSIIDAVRSPAGYGALRGQLG